MNSKFVNNHWVRHLKTVSSGFTYLLGHLWLWLGFLGLLGGWLLCLGWLGYLGRLWRCLHFHINFGGLFFDGGSRKLLCGRCLAGALLRRGLGLEECCKRVLSLSRGGLARVFLVDGFAWVRFLVTLIAPFWRLLGLWFAWLVPGSGCGLRGLGWAVRSHLLVLVLAEALCLG